MFFYTSCLYEVCAFLLFLFLIYYVHVSGVMASLLFTSVTILMSVQRSARCLYLNGVLMHRFLDLEV